MIRSTNWIDEIHSGKYDDWKLSNQSDKKERIGAGGKWGTVEYTYMVEQIGKCPCCNEKIMEDELFVEEDGILYHFSCYNYKKKAEEEDKRNGK
jgi:hypothetical protein